MVNLEQGYKGTRRFQEQKTRLLRALADAAKQAPNAYAAQLSQHLTRRTHWLPEQLLAALKPLKMADLANFGKAITTDDRTSVEGLVLGNLDAARAEKMLSAASAKLVAQPLHFAERPRQGVVDLQQQALVLPVVHPNKDEPNSAVQLAVQFGRLGPKQAATAELLSDMLGQPFFNELRTHQQLGYIVGSGLSSAQAVYTLGFVVQSAVQPPAEVSKRVLAFLATGPELVANNSADFRSFVAAAQAELREPPKRLSQASDMIWPRIAEGTYRFEWARSVADAMEEVSLADVQAMMARLLAKPKDGGYGRLLVLVHGKDHPLTSSADLAAKIGEQFVAVADSEDFSQKADFYTNLYAGHQGARLAKRTPAASAAAAAAPAAGGAPAAAALHRTQGAAESVELELGRLTAENTRLAAENKRLAQENLQFKAPATASVTAAAPFAAVTAAAAAPVAPVAAAPTALETLQSKAPATASVWAVAPFTAVEAAVAAPVAAVPVAAAVTEMAVEAMAMAGAAAVRAAVAAAPVAAAQAVPAAPSAPVPAPPVSSFLDSLRALEHAATRLSVFNFGDKAKEFWLESGKAETLLEWTEVS